MKTSLLITLSVITGIFLGALIALTIAVNNPITRLECPNKGWVNNSHEYQFDISDDGTDVYQGNRKVGFLPLDTTQSLDKLMMFDNQ